MTSAKVLRSLVRVILDEAKNNPEFDRKIREVLLPVSDPKQLRIDLSQKRQVRISRRRARAVLDPITIAKKESVDALRERLASLTVEQLKDIIAEYGMDSDRLAMKWKTADRLIDRIVQVATGRAHKGEAFM